MTIAEAPPATVSRLIRGGLEALATAQLATGELPAYRRGSVGNLEYCLVPIIGAYIHDALALFDSRSMWFDPAACETIDSTYRARCCRLSADIRRQLRRFIAWQQNSSGSWTFHGRSSDEPPDQDTTACAATALMEAPHCRSASTEPWYRGAAGAFAPADPVARLNWLRYRALAGDVALSPPPDWFNQSTVEAGRYAARVMFPFTVARTIRQCRFPDFSRAAEDAIRVVGEAQRDDGSFGGPTGTALGLLALLDLQDSGNLAGRALKALSRQAPEIGLWPFEIFLSSGLGSPALTTAFAVAALARGGWALDDHDA